MVNSVQCLESIVTYAIIDIDGMSLYTPAKCEGTLEKMFDLQEQKYHICPKHCRLFPIGSNDLCDCLEPQFKPNGKPRMTMSYFPLARQLTSLVANGSIRKSISDAVKFDPEHGALTDIFDGTVYKSFKNTLFPNVSPNKLDLVVSLFIDGFTPFKVEVLS